MLERKEFGQAADGLGASKPRTARALGTGWGICGTAGCLPHFEMSDAATGRAYLDLSTAAAYGGRMDHVSRCPRNPAWALLLLVGWLMRAGEAGAGPATAEDLRLVPFPKIVTLERGVCALAAGLVLEVSDPGSDAFQRVMNLELKRAGLGAVELHQVASPTPGFRLGVGAGAGVRPEPPAEGAGEGYVLEVRADEILCAANGSDGLFHGLQTLCQLIRANRAGEALPCLKISDWPSLRWRAFQDDMTRGPSSTLDTLQFEAGLGSYLKLNLMTYYMESQFAFRKHSEIGPADGSLTAGDLGALVAFAKPLHVDILGTQQSFGHMGSILALPQHAALRETPDVLTPVREETYRLLDDLYSESCAVLPFPWFNVCCDETDGLGAGPSRDLAAQIGVGGVYVRHLRRLHDLLRDKHQKRMMMWGDIILRHPANLAEVPKDTLLLTWGYDARASFEEQILPFAKAGFEFLVCPGVSDWNRILPDFGVAAANIEQFIRDGARHGAIGMLDTDWEDDGEALKAVKWHADAWAAECAWNASATPFASFNRRVGAVLFGEPGSQFGRAVDQLARTHRQPAMKDMFNSRFWEKDFVPHGNPAAARAAATNVLAVVRPALASLEACRAGAVCNQHLLEVFTFGARRMELIGQRMLDGLEAGQLYARAASAADGAVQLTAVEQIIRRTRDAHEAMGREFGRLWLAESKPYALDWTLRRYTNTVSEFDELLRRLAVARAGAAEGRPLPTAEEIGLAHPEPIFRRVRPLPGAAAGPVADLGWAEPSATHRLAMNIGAGANDRFDLPVEVELSLPQGLCDQPVRAFRAAGDHPGVEVPAQLEPLGTRGEARLILFLPGPLPKGSEAAVHVYLGLAKPAPRLAGAVGTHPGTNGMQWIENDQIRLLLGPEGAHLYRWELKGLGNRDLTMPGESGWAGFGDINPHRDAPYRLEAKAQGPALVEYECSDPWGHSQRIRLYAGVRWVEVLLSEPSGLYWDFDDPKNFAADGPTPGTWLFSDGRTGPVGREADGVPAQVKASAVCWSMKYNATGLALGLVTPETAASHVIAPGAGAGGVGIENSPPARHLVTYGGLLPGAPGETMDRLQHTLDLDHPIEVRVSALQPR